MIKKLIALAIIAVTGWAWWNFSGITNTFSGTILFTVVAFGICAVAWNFGGSRSTKRRRAR